MISAPVLTLAALAVWLCLAILMPWVRARQQSRLFWALVVSGVPMLGWLTLSWGPSAGVAGFAIGLLLLFRRPAAALRRPLR